MKLALSDCVAAKGRRAAVVLGLWSALFSGGCGSLPVPANLEPPASYHPANVAVEGFALPVAVRRVLLLPLAMASQSQALADGVDALAPVVDAELKKTGRFEVITISPEHLRDLTGQMTWRADETLPIDFFRRLQRDSGCDAVMFAEVTRYQPYPPLAVGWKFCLAAQGTGPNAEPHKLWSVDEVVDAGDGHIAHAARTYYSQHVRNEQPLADPATILRSPSLYGQFTLNALLATLPARSAN